VTRRRRRPLPAPAMTPDQLRRARDVARGPAGFHLPPDISFKKTPLGEGWSYVFRHRTLGELGRLVLQGTDGGQTFVRCEVVGDPADPMTAKRLAILEPVTQEMCERFRTGLSTATGRPAQLDVVPPSPPRSGGSWVESRLVQCEHCDVMVADLIYADDDSQPGYLEDYARKGYEQYSRINLPTWIIGPQRRSPSLSPFDRPADVLPVWPTRGPVERLTPNQFNVRLDLLTKGHCPGGSAARGERRTTGVAAGTPSPTAAVATRLLPCARCGTNVAMLIFADDATDSGRFEDCARKMKLVYTGLNVPTWIIGPPISGPWRLVDRPSDVMRVWPERGEPERLSPAQLEAVTHALCPKHCR